MLNDGGDGIDELEDTRQLWTYLLIELRDGVLGAVLDGHGCGCLVIGICLWMELCVRIESGLL